MNSGFENKLAEQNLRAAPAQWRAEILREARSTAVQPAPDVTGWRSWLWPAPQAWAALAACWLVLLAVNYFDRAPVNAAVAQADAARLLMALAEKQNALLELDVAVAAQQATPSTPRLPHGASGWLRDEKGEMPC